MAQNNFHQRLRQILTKAGGAPNGTEVFFMNGHDTQASGPFRTQCNIGVLNTVDGSITGSFRTTVDKMRLSAMCRNLPTLTVHMYRTDSSAQIYEQLVRKYGFMVDPAWFMSVAVPARPPFSFKTQFINTDWTMSEDHVNNHVTINVELADVDVADLFKVNVLDTPAMPFVRRLGYTNTEVLTYGVDFTPMFDDEFRLLRDIAKSEDIWAATEPEVWKGNNLITLMKSRLKLNVTRLSGNPGDFSLYNAKLVYNGPAMGMVGANVAYDNVLVFDTELDPTVEDAVYTYRGRVYIHYNSVI